MENIKDLLAYFEQQLRLVQSKELKYTSEEAYNDAADVCKNIINNKSEEDNGWDRAMIFNSPLKELVELKNKKDFLDSVDQSQWDEEWQKAWDDYKERKEQAWYQAKQVVMLWDKTDHGSISILKRTVLKQMSIILKAHLIISMMEKEIELRPEVKSMVNTWEFLQCKA